MNSSSENVQSLGQLKGFFSLSIPQYNNLRNLFPNNPKYRSILSALIYWSFTDYDRAGGEPDDWDGWFWLTDKAIRRYVDVGRTTLHEFRTIGKKIGMFETELRPSLRDQTKKVLWYKLNYSKIQGYAECSLNLDKLDPCSVSEHPPMFGERTLIYTYSNIYSKKESLLRNDSRSNLSVGDDSDNFSDKNKPVITPPKNTDNLEPPQSVTNTTVNTTTTETDNPELSQERNTPHQDNNNCLIEGQVDIKKKQPKFNVETATVTSIFEDYPTSGKRGRNLMTFFTYHLMKSMHKQLTRKMPPLPTSNKGWAAWNKVWATPAKQVIDNYWWQVTGGEDFKPGELEYDDIKPLYTVVHDGMKNTIDKMQSEGLTIQNFLSLRVIWTEELEKLQQKRDGPIETNDPSQVAFEKHRAQNK